MRKVSAVNCAMLLMIGLLLTGCKKQEDVPGRDRPAVVSPPVEENATHLYEEADETWNEGEYDDQDEAAEEIGDDAEDDIDEEVDEDYEEDEEDTYDDDVDELEDEDEIDDDEID